MYVCHLVFYKLSVMLSHTLCLSPSRLSQSPPHPSQYITLKRCFCHVSTSLSYSPVSSNYTCPLCNVSLVEMDDVWKHLDQEVENTPMPDEYSNVQLQILCRDCHKVSVEVPQLHYLPLKHSLKKLHSYVVRYPVLVTAQNALHFTPWQTN